MLKKRSEGVVAFAQIEETYCLRESNLAIWFLLLLMIAISGMVFNMFDRFSHVEYMPGNNIQECICNAHVGQPFFTIQLQARISICYNAVVILAIMMMTYSLHYIPKEFSIMKEL